MSGKSARPSSEANPVDVHVGKRVRLRRMMLGLSQEDIAKSIGVTFQQIQKYECAVNRLSATTLWELSRVLQCPVSTFFEGMDAHADAPGSPAKDEADDVSGNPEAIRLVRAFNNIKRSETRRQILDLASSLKTRREDIN